MSPETSPTQPAVLPRAPNWWRRALCGLYEGVLLFGVLFIADYFLDVLTQSRHALKLRDLRMLWLFLVLGVYFVWFWSHGGQTLPMKTWRMRAVDGDGTALSLPRATLRYLACWMVWLPGPALISLLPLSIGIASLLDLLVLFMLTLWPLVDRSRASLYDRILGTRLVDLQT
jgi:uncharacterized RDD family membrane protein YckC